MSENEQQLSVAEKVKKHFNTGAKTNSPSAGVSVITVRTRLSLLQFEGKVSRGDWLWLIYDLSSSLEREPSVISAFDETNMLKNRDV